MKQSVFWLLVVELNGRVGTHPDDITSAEPYDHVTLFGTSSEHCNTILLLARPMTFCGVRVSAPIPPRSQP